MQCVKCGQRFRFIEQKLAHERRYHQVGGSIFNEIQTQYNCTVYEHLFSEDVLTIEQAFTVIFMPLVQLIQEYLDQNRIVRFKLVLNVLIEKTDGSQFIIPMRNKGQNIFLSDRSKIPEIVKDAKMEFRKRQDGVLARTGSGERVISISSIRVELNQCNLFGGFAISKRKLTSILGNEYLTNPPTSHNNACFYRSVAMALSNLEDVSDIDKYIYKNFKYAESDFMEKGMEISKIRYFEKRNDENLQIGVNVYFYDRGMVYPVYRSIFSGARRKINLLLVPENNENHYLLINDIAMFLRKQKNHVGQMYRRNTQHCDNCLLTFNSEKTLNEHKELCYQNKTQKLEIPEKNSITKFKNFYKKFDYPIIGFADFEAVLTPEDRRNSDCLNCQNGGPIKNCDHATHVVNKHHPVCFSIVFVDKTNRILFRKNVVAKNDLMQRFFDVLDEAKRDLLPQLQQYKTRPQWNSENEYLFKNATHCHICEKVFTPHSIKVRDHDHYTGLPIGAAHQECNLNDNRVKDGLPIYIHNLAAYDQNFIVQHLNKTKGNQRLKALPINSQKFRTITIGKITFLDSLAMLDGSLETLVNSLKAGDHDFPIIKSSELCKSDKQYKMLIEGKGIFPYEWCENYEKLENATQFPNHEDFYSSLRLANVSVDDYQFGKQCFEEFNCKNMLDYMKIYCYLDTLLLAECVMKFRQKIEDDFGLGMTNYISLPQLSFDCMLRQTGCEIELISDPDMLFMVESNIRGGLSYINTRYINVENTDDCLVYVDANNLYSWAQSQKLPISNYEWLTDEEIDLIDWKNINEEDDVGYICMVDLACPKSMHSKYGAYPPVSESLNIFFEDLSPYSQETLIFLNGEKGAKKYSSTKLTGTFKEKENTSVIRVI